METWEAILERLIKEQDILKKSKFQNRENSRKIEIYDIRIANAKRQIELSKQETTNGN